MEKLLKRLRDFLLSPLGCQIDALYKAVNHTYLGVLSMSASLDDLKAAIAAQSSLIGEVKDTVYKLNADIVAFIEKANAGEPVDYSELLTMVQLQTALLTETLSTASAAEVAVPDAPIAVEEPAPPSDMVNPSPAPNADPEDEEEDFVEMDVIVDDEDQTDEGSEG